MSLHQFWMVMDQVGGLAMLGAGIWVAWLALRQLGKR